MNRTYFLLRHCSAVGQEPQAALSYEGIQQAKHLCRLLSKFKINSIVSSNYLRAVQSIEPFAKQSNLIIEKDDRLGERILSNRNLPDWKDRLRESFSNHSVKLQGGESGYEAIKRIESAIDDALSTRDCPVFVSHGNLLTLYLFTLDSSIGFSTWESMPNPQLIEINKREGASQITWHKEPS